MKKRPIGLEILDDLHDRITHYAESKADMSSEEAINLANGLVEYILHSWGGQNIYIPISKSVNTSAIRREIVKKFNGSNQRQLAHEFGVSLQYTYRILKRARKKSQESKENIGGN
ncbi:MAG: DNA-binding protein [Gammaproteobacteria bacterium]|nr:DNA-binding protein [Gammaproteobacteria bacterium]MCP5443363.1 DNA-binding protein [Chromatiaceae bacterium]